VAHRADYDAIILQKVYENLVHKLLEKGIRNINSLNDYIPQIKDYFFGKHVSVLVKNQKGLKDLYRLVSESHIKYFNKRKKTPTLPLSRLLEKRENLLLGSGCSNGVLWEEVNYDSKNIAKYISYFDYVEVLPPSALNNLVVGNMFSVSELKTIINRIIKVAKDYSKLVVAVSDAHYSRPEEKIVRDIYVTAKGIGGKIHPLFNRSQPNRENPDQHLLSTTEMLEQFSFLDEKTKNQIVMINPKLISSMVEEIDPIKKDLYTPNLPNTEEEFTSLIAENTKRLYGDNPDQRIMDRINKESDSIIKHGFAVIYNLSSRAVRKSIEDGFLVGSRGSVGSSIAATLTDITEVNPLEPHYRCPECKYHEFVEGVSCGYDLDTKQCPKCSAAMLGDGH